MSEKRIYILSKLFITMFTLIATQLCLINEHISVKCVGLLFTAYVFIISLASDFFCKKIISKSLIFSGFKRVLYYIGLFALFLICYAIFLLIVNILYVIPMADNLHGWDGLGFVVGAFLVELTLGITFVLPLIQAMFVLTLSKFSRKHQNNNLKKGLNAKNEQTGFNVNCSNDSN